MRHVPVGLLCLLATALLGCGARGAKELLAFGDQSTAFCSELAGRMSESWARQERAVRRAVRFVEADAEYFDASRKSCSAALRLLNELDTAHAPLPEDGERDLQRLLTLERLLLQSVADPDMPWSIFEATRRHCQRLQGSLRSRLNGPIPMQTAERQRLASELAGRWKQYADEASLEP